jgi:ricin-type beta-trefoil lectin protein/putative Ig domain-containing protein
MRLTRTWQALAAAGVLTAGLAGAAATAAPASAAAPAAPAPAPATRAGGHTTPVPRGISISHPASARAARPAITKPRKAIRPRAQGTGNLLYRGGLVQPAPVVYLIFWGSWWNSTCTGSGKHGTADQAYLFNYFHALSGPDDGLSPVDSQYNDSLGQAPGYPRVIWGDWAADCNNPPAAATGAQLASEAAGYAQFLAGQNVPIGANTQIIVVSPSGTNPGGGFGTTYCAWHSFTAFSGGSNFSFTNLPYQPDEGSNCGAGLVRSPLDGWSIVAGHEYAESVTDPLLDGWLDAADDEVADKCAWTNLFAQRLGGSLYAQQPLWDNQTGSCRQVTSSPDTVTTSPVAAQSTKVGGTVSLPVSSASSGGFTLTYTATGLPPGLSINSATGVISGTATWPGNYTVTAGASDSTKASATVTFTWRINPVQGQVKLVHHPTHCVNDNHASLASGTAVNLWSCSSALAESWAAFPDHTLRRYGGVSHIDTNRCVSIASSGTANGTKLTLRACGSSWSQQWAYHPGSHEWVNPHTGKCLDDPGGNLANGTRLVISTCNGGTAEQWTNV